MDQIIKWLQTFPQWHDTLYVDHIEPHPGCSGLYPKGDQLLKRQSDILGNDRLQLRTTYELRRVTPRGSDNLMYAQWLQQLQQWVWEQSRSGMAPSLGENTQWVAQKGRLSQSNMTGSGVYTLELVAQYWK